MTVREMEGLVGILTEANMDSIFCEIAFLESWVASYERRHVGIPLAFVEEHLEFFETEFQWKPRTGPHPLAQRAWVKMAAAFALFGTLVGGGAQGI
jgi:hypothetical protein